CLDDYSKNMSDLKFRKSLVSIWSLWLQQIGMWIKQNPGL
ncbi:unnamed protein product, partial [marine sediment metagenome]